MAKKSSIEKNARRRKMAKSLSGRRSRLKAIAGDVSTDEIKTLAEATYGKVAKVTEIGPRHRPQEPAQIARYDTMLLRLYYAEGSRPGMTGAELAGRVMLAIP